MPDDFRMKVFMAVALEKSFTKAAARLNISQPAVSQHISETERLLGVKLFQRLYGETVLTPAGEVFRSFAERLLSDYRRMSFMFASIEECQVSVYASEEVFDYLVCGMLADFMSVHPEISFVRSSSQESDLRVTIDSVEKEKGMLALVLHPSASFAATRLWQVLSQVLEPALK